MKVRLWLVIILVILSILGVALANSGFTGYTVGGYSYPESRPNIIVDNDTGVNYIIIERSTAFGVSVAICPRYNSDGTIYVDSEY